MNAEYVNAVRVAVENALRGLREELKPFHSPLPAPFFLKDRDIGPVIYELGEAYRRPGDYTVSRLQQAVEAFLRVLPEPLAPASEVLSGA